MMQKIFANSLLLGVILGASFNLAAMDPAENKAGFTVDYETNVLFSQESELVDFLETLIWSTKRVLKLQMKADNALKIDDKTKELFAKAIASHKELKWLTIKNIMLDNNGIAFLADALKSLRLKVLCLSGVTFDDMGLKSLSDLLAANTSIIVLELSDNQAITGNPGVFNFTKDFLLVNKTIRSIKILNCPQVMQGSRATVYFWDSIVKTNPPCNLEIIELPFPINSGLQVELLKNRKRVQDAIEIRKNPFVVIFCAASSEDFRAGNDESLGAIEVLEQEIWFIILQLLSEIDL